MSTKIIEDYASINQGLTKLTEKEPDWMPKCKYCHDTGFKRVISKDGWEIKLCPLCATV